MSKLLLYLSLTHLRAQITCYELKGVLSPVMLNKIFHDSFENFEITRICMKNHASVTGWQKLFFSNKCFQLSAAVAIAAFEIYGWKFSGYLILICFSASADKIFQKWIVFLFTESRSRDQVMQSLLRYIPYIHLNVYFFVKLKCINFATHRLFTLKKPANISEVRTGPMLLKPRFLERAN